MYRCDDPLLRHDKLVVTMKVSTDAEKRIGISIAAPSLRGDKRLYHSIRELYTLLVPQGIRFISTDEPRRYLTTRLGFESLESTLNSGSVSFLSMRSDAGSSAQLSHRGWTAQDEYTQIDIEFSINGSGYLIDEIIRATRMLCTRIEAISGFVTVLQQGEAPWRTFSENDRHVPMFMHLWEVNHYLRGVYWCNYISDNVAKHIGGRSILLQSNAFLKVSLSNGVWLQLSNSPPPEPQNIYSLERLLHPLLDLSDYSGRSASAREAFHKELYSFRVVPINVALNTVFGDAATVPLTLLNTYDQEAYQLGIGSEDVVVNLHLQREPSEGSRALIAQVVDNWQKINSQGSPEDLGDVGVHVPRMGLVRSVLFNRLETHIRFDHGTFDPVDAITSLRALLASNPDCNVSRVTLGIEEVG